MEVMVLTKNHFAQMHSEETLILIANVATIAQILCTNYQGCAIFPVIAFVVF